jgi:hypothetical protein
MDRLHHAHEHRRVHEARDQHPLAHAVSPTPCRGTAPVWGEAGGEHRLSDGRGRHRALEEALEGGAKVPADTSEAGEEGVGDGT